MKGINKMTKVPSTTRKELLGVELNGLVTLLVIVGRGLLSDIKRIVSASLQFSREASADSSHCMKP
jgi:hypothetical protein